ncbi:hypothetical protein APHAL10511_006007 [Amanita phalloides]|nr:hypothetical protein APHAL10511_006007 [Amanita phalloides]
MFIAIVGTRFSGKSFVEDFLISCKGFTLVRLSGQVIDDVEQPLSASLPDDISVQLRPFENNEVATLRHLSFLSMSPTGSPAPTIRKSDTQLFFSNSNEMLDYVTRRWQDNFVTSDLRTREQIEIFVKRPFFLLVSVDAPLCDRFRRSNMEYATLEDFVREDDRIVFGGKGYDRPRLASSLHELRDLIGLQITNSFQTLSSFESYLEDINMLDSEHIRPGWDAYFMILASLASRRSNCMKRRVGAVLVRDHRVIATGYNGTARGLLNCNEGGCPECNKTGSNYNTPYECVCLHAEENALLEAGRERIGQDAVLYCNTCPCLKCTVKIIQTGVKTVVYNLSYKVDDASAALFKQARVELRRFKPTNRFKLDPQEGSAMLIPELALSN